MLASSVKIESTQDKLDWMFRAFDADNGGRMTEAEIREIVIYLFKVADIEQQEDVVVTCIADIKLAHSQLPLWSSLNYFAGKLSVLTAIERSPRRNLSRMVSRAPF